MGYPKHYAQRKLTTLNEDLLLLKLNYEDTVFEIDFTSNVTPLKYLCEDGKIVNMFDENLEC